MVSRERRSKPIKQQVQRLRQDQAWCVWETEKKKQNRGNKGKVGGEKDEDRDGTGQPVQCLCAMGE